MSIVKVWDGTAWQSVDDSGPVGDKGVIGNPGSSTRISNCVWFGGSHTVPDGASEAPALGVRGSSGVQPCMVISGAGNNRLKAVKAGVHVITLSVGLWAVSSSTPDNYILIERAVAVGGETRIGSGDIARFGWGQTVATQVWLSIGEEIYFYFSKKTGGTHQVDWEVRAVMMQ
jgi:hypothetical protein